MSEPIAKLFCAMPHLLGSNGRNVAATGTNSLLLVNSKSICKCIELLWWSYRSMMPRLVVRPLAHSLIQRQRHE